MSSRVNVFDPTRFRSPLNIPNAPPPLKCNKLWYLIQQYQKFYYWIQTSPSKSLQTNFSCQNSKLKNVELNWHDNNGKPKYLCQMTRKFSKTFAHNKFTNKILNMKPAEYCITICPCPRVVGHNCLPTSPSCRFCSKYYFWRDRRLRCRSSQDPNPEEDLSLGQSVSSAKLNTTSSTWNHTKN